MVPDVVDLVFSEREAELRVKYTPLYSARTDSSVNPAGGEIKNEESSKAETSSIPEI